MSDEAEIGALVHSYARLLDGGDVDGVVALFEHSTWRSLPNGSILQGPAVRPVYERLVAETTQHQTKHLITNLSIQVDPGSMSASSHCYWTVLQGAPNAGIGIALSGQYTDTFEKVAEPVAVHRPAHHRRPGARHRGSGPMTTVSRPRPSHGAW